MADSHVAVAAPVGILTMNVPCVATALHKAVFSRGRCAAAVLVGLMAGGVAGQVDDSLERYFDQLRRRGLFAVAETYALTRLAEPQLKPERRSLLVLELSRTYADHAAFTDPPQQEQFWQKARQVIEAELERRPTPPHAELLRAQQVFVTAVQSEVLWRQALLQPDDIVLERAARRAAEAAVADLTKLVALLSPAAGEPPGALPAPQRRVLLQSALLELGHAHRRRAELLRDQPAERASDLHEAEQAYRQALALPGDVRRGSLAKLGLVECLRLRRAYERARELLTALTGQEPPVPADVLDSVDAARVRTWLDEGKPVEAAEYLLGVRQARPQLSGELWLLQLQTLLHLRAAADQRGDQQLAAQLRSEAERVLERVDESAGGIWSRYCRILWSREQTRERFGAELDELIRRAQRDYAAGQHEVAAEAYAVASAAALAKGQSDLAFDLSYTRGSILLEREQFEAAAEELRQLADRLPQHSRAAAAHLLAAYALGRRYEQQRTQSQREAYTQALEDHLARYAESPTAGDAHFMLGRLQEQRVQWSKALPQYLAVPVDHPRGHEATIAAARCCQAILTRMKQQGQPWEALQREACQAIADRLQQLPEDWSAWSTAQAEAVLGLTRLMLTSAPPDYRAADRQLEMLQRVVAAHRADNSPTWKDVARQMLPLRLLTLAGTGRNEVARSLLTQLPGDDPQQLWAVVRGLDQLAAAEPAGNIVELTELCVAAVARLEPLRGQLSPADQHEFDMARLRAYVVTGRWDPAVRVGQELAGTWSKDVGRMQELAAVLQRSSAPELQQLARNCWRRVEALTPAGSNDWLSARAAVIELAYRLGEKEDAAKLFKVTRLLYPQLPSEDLRQRYDALERSLSSRR
jgi:TolA-binding protein